MNNITPELEVWKPVVGFEGLYEVSNLGRVKRINPSKNTYVGRILKPSPNGGYLTVSPSKNGVSKRRFIHILVARAFLGESPTLKHEINHKNGIKTDNRVDNLEWSTHLENMQHANETGLRDAWFYPKEIQDNIISLLKLKPRLTLVEIAQRCNVGIHIVRAELKHTKRPASLLWDGDRLLGVHQHTGKWARIQDDDVQEIKQLLREGRLNQREIADKFGVTPAVVTRIKKGTYYDRHVVDA